MFKPYWKSKTHIIIFILFLVTLLAPFVYVSAISIYSVTNNDPFIVEDEKIILGEAILFGLAIIFTLTFVIDLILYFGNKKAYKRYLKLQNEKQPQSMLEKEVVESIEKAKDNTETYLTNDQYYPESKLLLEKDEVLTAESFKKRPYFKLAEMTLGLGLRAIIVLALLTIVSFTFGILCHWTVGYTLPTIVFFLLTLVVASAYFDILKKGKLAVLHLQGKQRVRIFDNRIEILRLNEDDSINCLIGHVMFANANCKETKKHLFLKGTFNNMPMVICLTKEDYGEEFISKLMKEHLCYTFEQENNKRAEILVSIIARVVFLLLFIFSIILPFVVKNDPRYAANYWQTFGITGICSILFINSIISFVLKVRNYFKWRKH